jgi:aspartokinase
VGELTPRTSDAIASFGELLSSQVSQLLLQQTIRTAILKTVIEFN